MPPNFGEVHIHDAENHFNEEKGSASTVNLVNRSEENYKLKIFHALSNILAHTLIGAVTGISIFWAFRNGPSLAATSLHVILCVVGYQLLMAQAILALSPHNSWTASMKHIDRRRVHWILQILGSGLAVAGSFIKILDKTVHWNTLHGQFALVALVFTSVCFFNGLTSNYAYELRKFIPTNLSKLTHICFGIVAFASASICLCYGFDKMAFRNWGAPGLAPTAIAFTAAFTAIVIFNPLVTFAFKSYNIVKK